MKRNDVSEMMFLCFLSWCIGSAWAFASSRQIVGSPLFRTKSRLFGKVEDIGLFPCFRLQIDEKQNIVNDTVGDLINWVDECALDDVWVVSHGWFTTEDEAMGDYRRLFGYVSSMKVEKLGEARKMGIVAVIWPSYLKEFMKVLSKNLLLDGEGIKLSRKFALDSMSRQTLEHLVQQVKSLRESEPALLHDIDFFDEAQADLKRMLRSFDYHDLQSQQKAADDFVVAIVKAMNASRDSTVNVDGFSGNITEYEGLWNDMDNRIERAKLLDGPSWTTIFTFDMMMKRAAATGMKAISPALLELQEKCTVKPRLHLVGHSFGALLMAAACNTNAANGTYCTLTMLQGALSQNSFAKGFMFRNVVTSKAVSGPIAVTYTENDWALLYAYDFAAWWYNESGEKVPLAKARELLAKKKVDYTDSKFGALGSNGSRKLSENEFVQLVYNGEKLSQGKLEPDGVFNNILGSDFISGHTDVWNVGVANLLIDVVKFPVNEKKKGFLERFWRTKNKSV